MIKFKELLEKSGAGDWGTDEARKTLQRGTPGQGITNISTKNKERKESVELNEATDFRAGDTVYQVGSKLKGTVLHKGNQDKIVVKFGSVNKMIPASQLRLAESAELDEAQFGVENPYKKYKNDPDRLRRMLKKHQEAEGNMRNRIRKFMGSAPSGLKDELKDIEKRIKQIKDVMREEVELDEEKVIKIVADTNTRKYKEGEVLKTFPETKAGLTKAMVFQKTVKDRYGAETKMVRESVELDEGAVAVSNVEKEIRKNGGTQVKKSDREITFVYKGSERKIPVDRGFVKSDHYMKIQDMMEEVQ